MSGSGKASKIFNHIPAPFDPFKSNKGLSPSEANTLQDFLIHKLILLSIEHDVQWQIHTGNIWLEKANPSDLIPVLTEYKEANFDIFHASYPYVDELTTIARRLPNIYVDLCWVHGLSTNVAQRILNHWIDILPSHKILAFGGDYFQVESTYSHSVQARENVTRVLAERIERGSMTLEEAEILARRILRENADELFHLKDKGYLK